MPLSARLAKRSLHISLIGGGISSSDAAVDAGRNVLTTAGIRTGDASGVIEALGTNQADDAPTLTCWRMAQRLGVSNIRRKPTPC
jgi:hypothetical protein